MIFWELFDNRVKRFFKRIGQLASQSNSFDFLNFLTKSKGSLFSGLVSLTASPTHSSRDWSAFIVSPIPLELFDNKVKRFFVLWVGQPYSKSNSFFKGLVSFYSQSNSFWIFWYQVIWFFDLWVGQPYSQSNSFLKGLVSFYSQSNSFWIFWHQQSKGSSPTLLEPFDTSSRKVLHFF